LVAILFLISVMSSATAAKPRSTVERIAAGDALRFLFLFGCFAALPVAAMQRCPPPKANAFLAVHKHVNTISLRGAGCLD
jgi:hypothetical protein